MATYFILSALVEFFADQWAHKQDNITNFKNFHRTYDEVG